MVLKIGTYLGRVRAAVVILFRKNKFTKISKVKKRLKCTVYIHAFNAFPL